MPKPKATLNQADLQLIANFLKPQFEALHNQLEEQEKHIEALKLEIDKRFRQQLRDIEPLVDYHLGQAFDFHFKENMQFYPTKDDLYTKWDQVITELKVFREERLLITHRLSEQETRLLNLEDIHPNFQHS